MKAKSGILHCDHVFELEIMEHQRRHQSLQPTNLLVRYPEFGVSNGVTTPIQEHPPLGIFPHPLADCEQLLESTMPSYSIP